MINSKKKTFGKILTSLLCVIFVIALKTNAHAAGEYATLSGGGNVSMGATVSVSLNLKSTTGLGSVTGNLTYDSNVLKFSECSGATVNGGGGSVSYSEAFNGEKTKSITFKFTTIGQGTGTVNLNQCIIADFDTAAEANCSGGKATVTVGAANAGGNDNGGTKKGDARLSALKISPGELQPAFAAGTYTYNVEVPEGTKTITVSATPAAKTSKVKSVNGAKSIEHGANTVTIIVEANDGATITYKLNVYCGVPIPGAEPQDTGGAEEVDAGIGGKAYTILNTIPESEIPQGFALSTAKYNSKTIRVVTNETLGLSLAYLKNRTDDSKSFFVLDQGILIPYLKAALADDKYIIILQPDITKSVPRTFVNATGEVLGVQLDCLKHENNSENDFLYVYAVNEAGKRGWYRYDTVTKNFQRYDLDGTGQFEDELMQSKDKADKWKLWFIIAAAGAGVFFIVMIILICVVASKSKKLRGEKAIENIRANEQNELQKAVKRSEPKPIAMAKMEPKEEPVKEEPKAEPVKEEPKPEPTKEEEPERELTEEEQAQAELAANLAAIDFDEIEAEESGLGKPLGNDVKSEPSYSDDDYHTAEVEEDDDYNTAVVEDDDDYKRVSNRPTEEENYNTEFEFIDFDD